MTAGADVTVYVQLLVTWPRKKTFTVVSAASVTGLGFWFSEGRTGTLAKDLLLMSVSRKLL